MLVSPEGDVLYDYGEAAEMLGRSPMTLRNWVSSGMAHRKIGRSVYFTAADIATKIEVFPGVPGARSRPERETPPRRQVPSQRVSEVA